MFPLFFTAALSTASVISTVQIKEEAQNLHALIGITLVLGFVLMLLIDQISSAKSRRGMYGVDT